MAYTLYITRPPHYRSVHRKKISVAAWRELIAQDATLTLVEGEGEGAKAGGRERGKEEGKEEGKEGPAAVFEPGPEGPMAVLYFRDGNILCQNPDEPTVDKMLALAAALEAQVQGEDGEIHISSTEPPHLVQFTLFDRVSQRLRVRFPPPSARRVAEPRDVAALVATPVYLSVERVREEETEAAVVEAVAAEEAVLLRVPERLGRMIVGFPNGQRKPSAALQKLLNPLRPAS